MNRNLLVFFPGTIYYFIKYPLVSHYLWLPQSNLCWDNSPLLQCGCWSHSKTLPEVSHNNLFLEDLQPSSQPPKAGLAWSNQGLSPSQWALSLPFWSNPLPLCSLSSPSLGSPQSPNLQADDPFLSPPWDGLLHFFLASSPGQTLHFSLTCCSVEVSWPGSQGSCLNPSLQRDVDKSG